METPEYPHLSGSILKINIALNEGELVEVSDVPVLGNKLAREFCFENKLGMVLGVDMGGTVREGIPSYRVLIDGGEHSFWGRRLRQLGMAMTGSGITHAPDGDK